MHEAVDMKSVESRVCMLTAMNWGETASKKVAPVSTAQSPLQLAAKDKAQHQYFWPQSNSPLTLGGTGNIGDFNDTSSHYSKALLSSSSAKSTQAVIHDAFKCRSFLSSWGSSPKNVNFSNGTYIKSDMPDINR
jgi:hypothetical protein